jgi:hypothetical protein
MGIWQGCRQMGWGERDGVGNLAGIRGGDLTGVRGAGSRTAVLWNGDLVGAGGLWKGKAGLVGVGKCSGRRRAYVILRRGGGVFVVDKTV